MKFNINTYQPDWVNFNVSVVGRLGEFNIEALISLDAPQIHPGPFYLLGELYECSCLIIWRTNIRRLGEFNTLIIFLFFVNPYLVFFE